MKNKLLMIVMSAFVSVLITRCEMPKDEMIDVYDDALHFFSNNALTKERDLQGKKNRAMMLIPEVILLTIRIIVTQSIYSVQQGLKEKMAIHFTLHIQLKLSQVRYSLTGFTAAVFILLQTRSVVVQQN